MKKERLIRTLDMALAAAFCIHGLGIVATGTVLRQAT